MIQIDGLYELGLKARTNQGGQHEKTDREDIHKTET